MKFGLKDTGPNLPVTFNQSFLFQVVCEPRLGQKLKKQLAQSLSSTTSTRFSDDVDFDQDGSEDEERRQRLIGRLMDTVSWI